MKKLVVLVVMFALIWYSFAFSKLDFSWKVVKVYDGDTFWIENNNLDTKIRVLWIDSPEIYHNQKIKSYKFYGCGQQAQKFAEKLLLNKNIYLYSDSLAKNRWKYHRLLRYAKIPITINWKKKYFDFWAIMIYNGWAKVYKWEKFTKKSWYYKLEKYAKKHKRWIWSSKCQLEDKIIKQKYIKKAHYKNNYFIANNFCWYTYHKKGCDIKWNINRKGVKIYHMFWWRYYNITKINPRKGERWFCTEQQARNCGWRASYAR